MAIRIPLEAEVHRPVHRVPMLEKELRGLEGQVHTAPNVGTKGGNGSAMRDHHAWNEQVAAALATCSSRITDRALNSGRPFPSARYPCVPPPSLPWPDRGKPHKSTRLRSWTTSTRG